MILKLEGDYLFKEHSFNLALLSTKIFKKLKLSYLPLSKIIYNNLFLKS